MKNLLATSVLSLERQESGNVNSEVESRFHGCFGINSFFSFFSFSFFLGNLSLVQFFDPSLSILHSLQEKKRNLFKTKDWNILNFFHSLSLQKAAPKILQLFFCLKIVGEELCTVPTVNRRDCSRIFPLPLCRACLSKSKSNFPFFFLEWLVVSCFPAEWFYIHIANMQLIQVDSVHSCTVCIPRTLFTTYRGDHLKVLTYKVIY